jgi:hypothetical protein
LTALLRQSCLGTTVDKKDHVHRSHVLIWIKITGEAHGAGKMLVLIDLSQSLGGVAVRQCEG